ncbi:MAG: hypothetical protein ACK4GT_03000 [Pararhodobacter sp.]
MGDKTAETPAVLQARKKRDVMLNDLPAIRDPGARHTMVPMLANDPVGQLPARLNP